MAQNANITISSIIIEVFQHATESEDLILKGLTYLIPTTSEDIWIKKLTSTKIIGYHKNEIHLHSLTIPKNLANETFKSLMSNMKSKIRIDAFSANISEKGDIHVRIDKQELIKDGNLQPLVKNPINNTGVYKIICKFSYFGKKTEKKINITNFISKFL